MNFLTPLYVTEHLEFIQDLISKHIEADLVVAGSRNEIGNRIGFSKWGGNGRNNQIFLPRTISVNEQISAILDMMKRERPLPDNRLSDHANDLLTSGSLLFLEHLVLHEIAHIKHQWSRDRERECDLWAWERLEGQKGKPS